MLRPKAAFVRIVRRDFRSGWASLGVTKLETKMNLISRFVRDESGATAIEYGLIAALIAVVIITGVTAVGTKLSTTFTNLSGQPELRLPQVFLRTAAREKAAVPFSGSTMMAEVLVVVLLPLLLAAAAGWDLASFTIPNFLTPGAAGRICRCSPWRPGLALPAIGWHLLAGLVGPGARLYAVRAGLDRRRRRQAVCRAWRCGWASATCCPMR